MQVWKNTQVGRSHKTLMKKKEIDKNKASAVNNVFGITWIMISSEYNQLLWLNFGDFSVGIVEISLASYFSTVLCIEFLFFETSVFHVMGHFKSLQLNAVWSGHSEHSLTVNRAPKPQSEISGQFLLVRQRRSYRNPPIVHLLKSTAAHPSRCVLVNSEVFRLVTMALQHKLHSKAEQ